MSAIKEWAEVSRKTVFKKFSRQIDEVIFKLPDGTKTDFYINAVPNASNVLALTDKNEVVLVKQFRAGPKLILDELPGGFVDPGEDPLVTAQREFREETGYEGKFEFIGTCVDDAYSTMIRYCYVAKNCRMIGEPQHTATEHTEVILVSLKDFRDRLRKGQMTDVEVGYLGLDYLGLL